MDLYIGKSTAKGSVRVPPSKSMAHRHIICAALAEGRSTVRNVDLSEDIRATLDCIEELGAATRVTGDVVEIDGIGGHFVGNAPAATTEFYCRESGSTMRFFMGIVMARGGSSRFFGSETLRARPFSVYEDICAKSGIVFKKDIDSIYIDGRLKPGEYVLPGNVSSQFVSGLLFALPMLDGDSVIRLVPPVESGSYIRLTLSALARSGIRVESEGDMLYRIPGRQRYVPVDITVEGDYSNAAFLEAFNMLGGDVVTEGLSGESLQGDRVYPEYFAKLKNGYAELDISDCPDLGPVLFAVAAANGGGFFTGTSRLKIKESDRGHVMCEELAVFGVEAEEGENTVRIGTGGLEKPSRAVSGHNDHRIVMAMALLLSATGGELKGAEAVTKSYPGFFEDISSLGIEVEEIWNG